MLKAGFTSTVILAAIAFLVWLANRSAYFPMKHPQGEWGGQAWAGAEDVWVTTSDGVRLNAWWRPVDGAQWAALFLHGNAGNVTHRAPTMKLIGEAGGAVLVVDYRGYGKSEGSPSERGFYRDAEAAYEWLLARGWPPERIAIHGESLGTAVAVELASRRKCAAVILEAPFTSMRAVAGRVVPLLGPALVWGFDSKSKIKSVSAPLLVIHGDRDEVIDYDLGQTLFAAAREPKQMWTVAGAHHNDIAATAGSAYPERLRRFMMDACNAAPSSPSPSR